MESQSETTQTVSALKLLVLKTRDYDLWSMRIEQYLTHTDYARWEVIVNGDAPAIASASAGTEGPIPPKTVEQKLARKNELNAKSTLLLAFPDEHLLKFHGIKDAKTLWEAIKARSLPLAWNNIALIMRKKSDLDTLSMDDLYKVYKADIKGQSSSSSISQNTAFVSSENTRITNKAVNTAHEVSTASSHGQASSSTYVDDVMFSFFANQSNSPQLDNEDLEQIDTDDLEEMDLKWQVAMLTMRVKRFLKKTGRNLNFNSKETVGFNKTKGNRNGDAPRRIVPVETPANALVVQDGISGYDWSFQAEEGLTNFALMAYTSQSSSSSSSSDSKYDVQVKDISIKDLKNQLEEALKENDDLKHKLEKFEESSNNLTKLINSQISAKYKVGLGYDSQMNKSEVVHSVLNSRESDVDDGPVNDRFKIDDFVYKTKVSENETSISKTSKDIIEKPKTVRPNAHIIEDWDTDSDNNKKLVLNNKGRVTGQREIRPVWNNAQRVNHQNKFTHPHPKRNFVPTAVVTKSGQVPVNTAKQSSPRAAALISNPQYTLQDQGIFDSGCSRHMTGNKSFLIDYQEIDGGFVAFGGSPKGGKINGKRRESNTKLPTPQQNGVAERKNMTLIEAARTMLADLLLPTTFWAKAVSNARYVHNRVLVTKPHNKIPYELLHGRPPSISFMRPFRCPVTILNTLDPLGKFDEKANKGFFVGYSINSKAFRIFNTRTRKVEENMHINFLENIPNVAGSGLDWLFDIDLLTNSMNYETVTAGNQTNKNAGIKDNVDAVPTQQYILLPLLYDSPQSSKDAVADDAGKKTNEEPANKGERNGQQKEGGASNKEDDQNVQDFRAELDNLLVQQKKGYVNNTNRDSTVSPSVSTVGQNFTNTNDLPTDPLIPNLEDTGIFSGAYDDEDVGAEGLILEKDSVTPCSELGSELTFLAGSELRTSELDTSELKTSEYRVNMLKSIDEGPFQMGTFQETLAEGTEGALHLGAKDLWDNGQQNRGQGNNARGAGAAGYRGAQNRVGNANPVFQAYNYDAFDSNIDEASPRLDLCFRLILSSSDAVYDKAIPSYDSDILSEDT
ncbi:ribonuclease H-like domain-containing protein [Tanacetum coccineum]|uniref:Ribonuclease H-like domain-containing protein n=1 Tax=Tanacetum coccineum TaxID=301880 RepID=A0ABQ5DEL9_9ASTR